MREFKFRAWDNVANEMLYAGEDTDVIFMLGSAGIECTDIRNVMPSGDGVENHEHLIYMQYTGLKINDKEIYEHDVLMIIAEDENGREIGREKCVVDFDRQAFVFAPSLKHRGLTQDALFKRYKAKYLRWELLGNIYENPELLEVSK